MILQGQGRIKEERRGEEVEAVVECEALEGGGVCVKSRAGKRGLPGGLWAGPK